MRVILLVSLLALSGCSTLADVKVAKGTGDKRIFDNHYDKVWKATTCSIHNNGLLVVSENKSDHSILAQRGMSAFSYGENVAVFLKKLEKNHTEVEVVSKKVVSGNILAPNWSKPILDGISPCLAGQQL